MLKIKDNVDLKELEKFGFVYQKKDMCKRERLDRQYTEIKYIKDFGAISCEVVESRTESVWRFPNKTREIYFYPNDYDMFIDKKEIDLIFDLIKADLVEKVEEL